MTGIGRLLRDLGYALRTMRRNPGSAAIAVLVLAIGIGPTTAMFSVVDKVLLQPLPYPESDRLVQFIVASPMGNATLASVPKFIAWREGRGVFEHVAAFTAPEPIVLATGGPPELASGMQVSAGYFPVFGVVDGERPPVLDGGRPPARAARRRDQPWLLAAAVGP